jgi:hypothetical protein
LRTGKPLFRIRGLATAIPFALLFLGVSMVMHLAAGSSIAEDLDYIPIYIRDAPAPSPGSIGPDIYITTTDLSTSPPPDPGVGDSWVWWLWVHSPMPPHFEQHVCTVRGKTDRGYVVVRDLEWLVSIDQTDVDSILEYWENISIGPYPGQGIYEIDSLAFGAPPDELDNDPRIYLMWFDFVISADGFFFWFDEFPEGTYPEYHSNECEVLYLNTMSQGGPSGDYMLAVAAHEFEHMIHWKYDANEDSWVNEGLAELAMWFFGNPDNISAFNSNPDNDLTEWGGNWADYIKTYLWSLYFFERYGGHPSIYAVLHEPANSIAGYNEVLGDFGYTETFEDVFADWAVANFLDDTSLVDGRFGYAGEDLPPFSVASTFSSYPVATTFRTVNHWATDYYRFQDLNGFESLAIGFDGSDDNVFAVWGLALYASGIPDVLRMNLDENTQAGVLEITGLVDPADEIILVVASTSSFGGSGYYFSAWDSQGIEHESTSPHNLSLSASPNPFSGSVNLQLEWNGYAGSGAVTVDIFDIHGRLVRRLDTETSGGSGMTIAWDGLLASDNPASPGIYYARVRIGGESTVASLLLLH